MLDMYKEVSDRYNLEIKNVAPYKEMFILNTSEGKKLLKKNRILPDRVLFIHSAKEYLHSKGFTHIDRYLCTVEGEPCISVDGVTLTLTDYIEGSECNFDNRNDIIESTRQLARLHKASKGFEPLPGSRIRDDLGRLPEYFSKRLEELKKLRKVAKKGRSKFDYMFLDHFDYYYRLGEDAIQKLESSNYNALVEKYRKEGMFCHHDYTHNNIITTGSSYYITNFDYCCYEIKVYDLVNLLRRKMRKCGWDLSEGKVIMHEYQMIEPISDDEMLILKIMMQFPQKLWRVVNKYYNSRRSWSERNFISRLQEVIDELEPHKKFMERFDSII